MANTPLYSRRGQVANNNTTGMNQPITAAANDFTGAGANNSLVFTADALGSYVQALRFKAAGTNVATVARIFINNGSANTTSTNNTFIAEVTLPATTSSSTAATSADITYALNQPIPAGFRIYVGLGTAVAGGWVVNALAGDF